MDFKVTSAEQKLLITLSNRLPFETVRMIQQGVLSVGTDEQLKPLADAAKYRYAVLKTLGKHKESKGYFGLMKRIGDMRNELRGSLETTQKDLA